MKDQSKCLLRISDFEWASGCRYIAYISVKMGLVETSGHDINSFRISSGGLDRTRKRKRAVKVVLEANIARIERFVGEHSSHLGGAEMSIIRGIWASQTSSLRVVREHLGKLAGLAMVQMPLSGLQSLADTGGPRDEV